MADTAPCNVDAERAVLDGALVGEGVPAERDRHTPICRWYEQTAVQLAGDLALLSARLRDVEAERYTYRALLQAALDVAAGLTAARDRDQARYVALLDELRARRGTDERRAA